MLIFVFFLLLWETDLRKLVQFGFLFKILLLVLLFPSCYLLNALVSVLLVYYCILSFSFPYLRVRAATVPEGSCSCLCLMARASRLLLFKQALVRRMHFSLVRDVSQKTAGTSQR